MRLYSSTRATRLLSPATRRFAPSHSFSTSTATIPAADEADTPFAPSPEHRALRELAAQFTASEVEPQGLQFNREERFNMDLFKRTGELGLLGVTVDPDYGGAGMDATASCIVHEELAASDPAFCLSYLAHSCLFVNNLARNGSHEQKAKLLPKACSGELIGGMGMSEPHAGTDVLGMGTRATKLADGSWSLTGAKMWITNGAVSDTELGDAFLVYARTGGPEVKPSKAISLFLVEKGTPGFSLGQRLKDKCGMRASPTAELVFDDCIIPASSMVGDEGGATICMMRNLEIERVVLAAMAVGIARRRSRRCATTPPSARRSGSRSTPSAKSSATSPRATPSTWRARPTSTRWRARWTLCRGQPPGDRRRQAVLHDDVEERRRPRDPGDGRLRLHGRVRSRAAAA